MVDGGGDFLDVVQEAGAAGGPHSRPAFAARTAVFWRHSVWIGNYGRIGVGLM